MANQRKPDKKQVTLWVTPEEKRVILKACEQSNLNMSDLIKAAVLRMLTEEDPNANRDKRQHNNN